MSNITITRDAMAASERVGKYGFSPSTLPFAELRPGTLDRFLVEIAPEILAGNFARIRSLIWQAARGRGFRVAIARAPTGVVVRRLPARTVAPLPAAYPIYREEDQIL